MKHSTKKNAAHEFCNSVQISKNEIKLACCRLIFPLSENYKTATLVNCFKTILIVLVLIGCIQSINAQFPWNKDTTFIYKNVIDKAIPFIDSIKNVDSFAYKRARKEFINWDYFHGTRLSEPNGTYGKFNQSLMDRIFPGTTTSTTSSQVNNVENFGSSFCINPCSTSGCYSRGKWKSIGPYFPLNERNHVGVVTKLIHSPYNSNVVYLGSVAGGMHKSTDGGQNWTPLDFVSSSGENAGTIGTSDIVVWHKSNPSNDIVIASTGFNWHDNGVTSGIPSLSLYGFGVVKSNDGGATWAKTSLSFDPADMKFVKRLIKDEKSSNIGTVYAIVGDSKNNACFLYKSQDFGQTWVQKSIVSDNDLQFLEIHPTNSNILYLASNTKLQRSDDGGDTWPFVYNYGSTMQAVHLTTLQNSSVSGSADNLYLVNLYYNGPNLYYQIKKSTNKGVSFTPIYTSFNNSGLDIAKIWLQVSQFTNESYETFYLGGLQVAIISPDFNGNYSYSDMYYYFQGLDIHPDIRYMKLYKSNSVDTLLVGTDGGPSRIINARSNNRTISCLSGKNLALSTFLHTAINSKSTELAMCMQDNGVQFLDNPKQNSIWNDNGEYNGDVGSNTYDRFDKYYYGGNFSDNLISNNSVLNDIIPAGLSLNWILQYQTHSKNYLYTSEDINNRTELCVYNILTGARKQLTSNGISTSVPGRYGNSITDIEVAKNNSNIIYYAKKEPRYSGIGSVSFTNANFGYRLWRSSQGINTNPSDWVEISAYFDANDMHGTLTPQSNKFDIKEIGWSASITDIEVNELNDNELWVSVGGFVIERIYHTTNASAVNSYGHSMVEWTPLTTNCLPPGPVNCLEHLPGPKTTLFAGTDAGVYYYIEGEDCWHPMNDGLPQGIVTDIKLDSLNNRLYISTYGRGGWSSPLPCLTCIPSPSYHTLTQDEIYDRNIFFNESIIIPAGKKLTIKNCAVHMPARSEIIVQKGGELIVDNARITSSCWRNWAGINIEGDGPVNPQSAAASGTVRIKNHSIIENTSNAIEIFEGGRLFAENSTFKNNSQSLVYYPYYGANVYQHTLNNITFLNDDTLNGGGAWAVQIVIMDNKIIANNCTFENSIKQEILLNNGRGTGIIVFNGALTMNPLVNYNTNSIPCQVTNIGSRGLFKQLDIGIEWYNDIPVELGTGRENVIKISDYDFINCARGIKAVTSQNDFLYHNKFKCLDNILEYLNPQFINSTNSESFISGIILDKTQGTKLYSNIFERTCNSTSYLNYLDTIYDIKFLSTDRGVTKSNVLTTILQDNEFSNPTRVTNNNGFKDLSVANYFYGDNQKLSMKCNKYENKLLDYLFHGDFVGRGYLNETVEYANGCYGLNTHNNYPSIQLIDERIKNGNPPRFIEWNSTIYNAVSNSCITSLSPNGIKYINNLATPANCSACTSITNEDVYCSGPVNPNGMVVNQKPKTKLENCSDADNLIKKLVTSDFNYDVFSSYDITSLGDMKKAGCLDSSSLIIFDYAKLKSGHGINKPDQIVKVNSVNLYPNPSDFTVNIDYNLEKIESTYQLILYDINGKVLIAKNCEGNSGKISFDSSHWADGIYYAVLSDGNHIVKTIKFGIVH